MEIQRVRSSMAPSNTGEVEMGSHVFSFDNYATVLSNRKSKLLSVIGDNPAADAVQLGSVLSCGRIVGFDDLNGQGICKRRHYCRRRKYCVVCKAIATKYRMEATAQRVLQHSAANHVSAVFTTPQPHDAETEYRHLAEAFKGLQKVKKAITAYNRPRPRDSDLNAERIHEYAIGLHLQPSESNPSLLWSHVHLFAAIGTSANVGTPYGSGLSSRLTEAFDSQLSDVAKHLFRNNGRIFNQATSSSKLSGKRPRSSAVQHFENALKYAVTLLKADAPPEVILAKDRLLARLASDPAVPAGTFHSVSRSTKGIGDVAPMRSLPNHFPGKSKYSVTYIFPINGAAPYRVTNENYDIEYQRLLDESRRVAWEYLATLEGTN